LKDETVLITGASSGIGLELARCFAAERCRLILLARNAAALEALAAELRQQHGVEARVLVADLALAETPGRIFNALQQEGVNVDVLVNNAGFGAHGKFAGLPLRRQLDMVQVNVTALMQLTGLFLPGMLGRGRGGVMNIASTAAFQSGPRMAVYYATKAFALSFSEAVAVETRGTGVTVTAVCPGPTHTNFGKAANYQSVRPPLRGFMTARAVAEHGHRAFRRGRFVVVSGVQNRLLTVFVRLLPRFVIRRAVDWLNAGRLPLNS
jgi:short-subunit dehydrogenase